MPRWDRITASARFIIASECAGLSAGATGPRSWSEQAFPFFACVLAGVDFPDVVFVFVCVIGSTSSPPCSALAATFVPRCARTPFGVERQCARAHFGAVDKSVLRNMAKILFLKCPTAGKDLITTKGPAVVFLRFAHSESISNLRDEKLQTNRRRRSRGGRKDPSWMRTAAGWFCFAHQS
jgi:hypothetical protein